MSHSLESISPIDGRYAARVKDLSPYFSEFALIKYRLRIEIEYLIFLKSLGLPQLTDLSAEKLEQIRVFIRNLTFDQAARVKKIEAVTNHDVKAVEYYLKELLEEKGLGAFGEFVHFGLTSQDINNTAVPLSLKEGLTNVIYPELLDMIHDLRQFAKTCEGIPMLARTHGQAASPTTLAKEIRVFISRMEDQLPFLYAVPFRAKFGGATGNFNAHFVAYPEIDWHEAGRDFIENHIGLSRSHPTTQIEPYDMLAAHCHAFMRLNTICIDLCRDFWTYISMDYFMQKVVAEEVGSSAMPHKVNPIDFENAEGNLGVANAIFGHLAAKLPISRLQRDLTDSTVAHLLIALKSIRKGLSRLEINRQKIATDLDQHWAVLAEAIQTILRREGFERPYELLKELSRGNKKIDQAAIEEFIAGLDVSQDVKNELLRLRPSNYIGK